MSVPTKADVDRMVAVLEEKAREARAHLDTLAPPGLERVTDEEFVVWMESQIAASPPETWADPEGRLVTGPPWLLMLGLCDNGEPLLRRYTRLRGGAHGPLPAA